MYWKAFLAEALMFCTILTCSALGAYSKTALFWLGIAKFWGHGGAPERPLCTTAPRSRCKGQWSPTCCWCTGRGWRWWSSCALVFSLGTCGVGRDDQTAMQQYTPKHWPVLTGPCFSVTCGYHICFTKRPPSTQWVSQVNDLCWDHWLLGVLQGRRLVEHNQWYPWWGFCRHRLPLGRGQPKNHGWKYPFTQPALCAFLDSEKTSIASHRP